MTRKCDVFIEFLFFSNTKIVLSVVKNEENCFSKYIISKAEFQTKSLVGKFCKRHRLNL